MVKMQTDHKIIKKQKMVVELINEFSENYSGKQKKYIKGFANGIENLDSSYGDNLKFALLDCKEIMEPFVKKSFENNYEDLVDEVAISINQLRNGVAHSRLDFKLEPEHLIYIKFVEEMLYAMRLKKIGVEKEKIQESINMLFKENIAL